MHAAIETPDSMFPIMNFELKLQELCTWMYFLMFVMLVRREIAKSRLASFWKFLIPKRMYLEMHL